MFDTTSDAYRKVEDELLPSEELLWIGQPSSVLAGMRSYPVSRLMSVFGIIVAFIFFGLVMFPSFSFRSGPTFGPSSFMNPLGAMLLPVMILGIVFLGLLASAVAAFLRMQNTLYAITDRRIIMLSGLLSTEVTSYGPQDIERIERRTRSGGSGDLVFRYEQRLHRYRSSGGFRRTRYDSIPVGFFGIPNVREVEALLLETFRPDEAGARRDADIEARTARSLWDDAAKPKRRSLEGDVLDEDDLIDLDALNADPDRLADQKPKRS